MSNPLSKAIEKGWTSKLPGEGEIIEYKDPLDKEISYPKDIYEQSNKEADTGYWVMHRSREILRELKELDLDQFVEVGAGTGSVCGFLVQNGIDVVAIEPLKAGAMTIKKMGINIICGRLEIVNFPTDSIKAFGAFDVLEHIENPNQLLEEMYRTLEPGGYLFATVPCGQWLWGDIDKSLGHYRRYSKRRINEVVSQSGFTLIKSRYLFFTLVPPALLLRAVPFRLGIQKSREQVIKTVQSEQTPSNFVNKLMKIILALESIFSRVIPLPYGLTIFSVYKKNSV